mgnify:CR=1 FL=1
MNPDFRLIFVLLAALVFVLFMDDGADDRWCKTYDFCEEHEMNIEDDHE